MNFANPAGLPWFDDDPGRSIQEKIAQAADRYRERTGYEPTVCELNPAQANALAAPAKPASRPKRAPQPALPEISLRLVASDHIQPHCFLVGIVEGDKLRPA